MALSIETVTSRLQTAETWMEINSVPFLPDPAVDKVKQTLVTQTIIEDIPLSEAALKASIISANDGDPADTKTYLKLTELSTGEKAQIAKVAHINNAKALRFLGDSFDHVHNSLNEGRRFQRLQGNASLRHLDIGVELHIGVPSYLKDSATDFTETQLYTPPPLDSIPARD